MSTSPIKPSQIKLSPNRPSPAKRLRAAVELVRMLAAGGLGRDGLATAPTIADIRELAARRLPKMAFDFADGGADAENTLRANIADLAAVTFVPRSLVDVSNQSLQIQVAGQRMPLPILLGPAGSMRVFGGDGELSAVRAAGDAGLTYTISTASSWSIEEIAAAATGPLWFQLYMWRDRATVRSLVERAAAAGCTALVVTVDVPVNGKRARDHRNGMSIPPTVTLRNAAGALRHPRWFGSLMKPPAIGFRNLEGIAEGSSAMSHQEYINTELVNLSATWDDIAWLRGIWDGPLFIKGVMSTMDAERAGGAGADGVFVSNHGGRQLDGLPSSISVLPRIVDAVGERMAVVLDGGIRSGGDVVKAMAMGADAVALGRSWVYGAAAGGGRGVERVIDIYRSELRETLILLGLTDIENLDGSYVNVPRTWQPGRSREMDTVL